MTYTIGKGFSFEAGHRLGGLPDGHKCARPHGHSYTVQVIVAATELTGPGFVTDFASLDPLKRHLADAYDHRMLNDVIDAEPTSEHLARVLFDWCAANIALPSAAAIVAVRVSETSSTWAEYRPKPAA
ncbi:6-carboxytetrahydropterin synthase [Frankia sp. AgB1.9]|uniref:6-pyruvoyl trahydropterin synthase family protein n=1 Tax=unclassified Frankia TaxID=2632575 RepID=UPI0019334C86|nr:MULTISPECIES: 6-carboxytetrahydropterin synthase [unclassified Frankia]MBL7489741.1 6-carboxytetrahydropterin synthase [Frankia sp. AgW1.1]MBL7551951.1 6-carboxytetrahydropterin synthase [Frankia sp. AgB1.9]MBL7623210.1 6-carboxytetrahydropterin synthase [Frankia sp. AgB1.8]